MSDVAAFFAACVASPALLTSTCASVIVPVLAWAVVRALRAPIQGMGNDSGWQAPLAAAAGALPGTLFVVLGAAALREGWGSACLQFATGRVLYGMLVALGAFGLARATWLAVGRARDVARLFRASVEPGERARRLGETANVRVREVHDGGSALLVAGVLRPVVFVSTGALDRVGDAELLAALRHEAAHARRGDVLCAAIVTFVADVVPLPAAEFLAIFRRAREFAADAHAIRDADPCDLAAALLSLARPHAAGSAAAAFADAGTVRDRLTALLSPEPARPSIGRRTFVAASLMLTFAAGAAPVAAAVAFGFRCSMGMPM